MTETELRTALKERLQIVEARIQSACKRAGRPREAVTLVAVTKTVSVDIARQLLELGIHNLGENRPQELWRKAEVLPKSVHWHLIGHLQRNKIERTLPMVAMIHSVDSLRLLDALEQEAERQHKQLDILLEVNASGESRKQGMAPGDVPALAERIQELQHLRMRGLMTMAAWEQAPEDCRPTFALLRQVRDRLQGELGSSSVLDHLSMGMTNDFEVAIEEGATMVRVGTALYEGIR